VRREKLARVTHFASLNMQALVAACQTSDIALAAFDKTARERNIDTPTTMAQSAIGFAIALDNELERLQQNDKPQTT